MLEIRKICDSCGNNVYNSQNEWSCWNTFNLAIAQGMARFNVSVDMCPACQDELIERINEKRAFRQKAPLTGVKSV